ncbi:zinc finger protein 3-like [Pollicipes pollicipes]|uniref:zinc finger protein 3-like n=1 Tax=Pollicipes pollicipes TaxID=41117 RepID=UPI001884AEE1|nr:zinc finger protein 3-like [Pollicipes pollicipes]
MTNGRALFSCDNCEKTYSSYVSLHMHQKVHTGLTTCALCGKTSSRVSDLRRHLHYVHRLEPCTCSICGRTYSSRSSLLHHRKVHQGATRCSLCGLVASKVAGLRTHLRRIHNLSAEEMMRLVPTRRRYHY